MGFLLENHPATPLKWHQSQDWPELSIVSLKLAAPEVLLLHQLGVKVVVLTRLPCCLLDPHFPAACHGW